MIGGGDDVLGAWGSFEGDEVHTGILEGMDEAYQPDGLDKDMEDLNTAVGIVVGASIGAFVLPLLFAILGGLKKSAGLTVAALIFTAISQAILSGVLLLILSAVVYIVQIVLCNNYKKA